MDGLTVHRGMGGGKNARIGRGMDEEIVGGMD